MRRRRVRVVRRRRVRGGGAAASGLARACAGAMACVFACAAPARAEVVVGGYVEAYGQWNANAPSNGITNLRGFDNRSGTLTLANAALDTKWGEGEPSFGRLTLQVGPTGATYYAAEPRKPGANGANASNAELWRYLQQAYVGQTFAVGRGLTLVAGLLLTPISPENMPVRDSMNWSRSNLFFALPYYQTGARLSTTLADGHEVSLMAFNGWNAVVDGNGAPSLAARYAWTAPEASLQLLYWGGSERPSGAVEGPALRHLFDAVVTWKPQENLEFALHADAGFEPTRLGVAHWHGAAAYARVFVAPELAIAARTDAIRERVPERGGVRATPMLLPVGWLASQTLTIDYRPHARTSIRLEGRDDRAEGDAFFGGTVQGDGEATPYAANRRAQQTITLGMTTWF